MIADRGRARIVDLPEFRDDGRGALAVAECGPQVPFTVHRVFTIHDMPPGVERGGHAHYLCEQFVLCVAGAVDLVSEDCEGLGSFRINKPSTGLYVPPLTWLSLIALKMGTVIVVLASDGFDEDDYIRDRADFDALTRVRSQ
jgi:UDP-2-acetamido-3-amino-2,3-dideoxy-glucuronate N-acetyltransferase